MARLRAKLEADCQQPAGFGKLSSGFAAQHVGKMRKHFGKQFHARNFARN
jgi:hypothetical protein